MVGTPCVWAGLRLPQWLLGAKLGVQVARQTFEVRFTPKSSFEDSGSTI